MTAYDANIVAKRLAHLEEATTKLEQERPQTMAQLQTKDALRDASFYRIQTCIEAIVDIGNHILAERYHQYPDTYKDTLRALGLVNK